MERQGVEAGQSELQTDLALTGCEQTLFCAAFEEASVWQSVISDDDNKAAHLICCEPVYGSPFQSGIFMSVRSELGFAYLTD